MNNENHNINPELEWDLIPTIHIEVGEFSADVIKLYELPHKMVNQAMSAQGGPDQMTAMLEVFRLAVVDPKKLEVLEYLSFANIVEILSAWTMRSAKQITDPEDELDDDDDDDNDDSLRELLHELAQTEGVEVSKVSIKRVNDLLDSLLSDDEEPQPRKKRKFFGNKKNNDQHKSK